LRLQITVLLMKTRKTIDATSLRFRRWSRAGYAVFCSLACTVTIGCVACSISDKSLQKGVGVSKNTLCAFAFETESRDTSMELLELEANLLQSKETTLFVNPSDRTAACPQYPNISFINLIG